MYGPLGDIHSSEVKPIFGFTWILQIILKMIVFGSFNKFNFVQQLSTRFINLS